MYFNIRYKHPSKLLKLFNFYSNHAVHDLSEISLTFLQSLQSLGQIAYFAILTYQPLLYSFFIDFDTLYRKIMCNSLLAICILFVIMCTGKMHLHVYHCEFQNSSSSCQGDKPRLAPAYLSPYIHS